MQNVLDADGKKCPICANLYTFNDPQIVYHVEYKPEITIDACRGCNYAEYLIRHPDIKSDYYMDQRKEKVRKWTIHNRPFIK